MGKRKKKQKKATEVQAEAESVVTEQEVEEAQAGEETVSDTYAKRLAYGKRLRDEGTLAFYRSLISMKADDIAPKPKKKLTKERFLRVLILTVAFLLLMGIFIAAAWSAIYDVVTYRLAEDNYKQLSENFSMKTDRSMTKQLFGSDDDISLPDFSEMLSGNFVYKEIQSKEDMAALAIYRSKLAQLKTQNPDTYGWMTIEGTNIDYPLVRGSDNEYYLDHDFSRNSYSAGALFVDYRCEQAILSNRNTVVYGHNIRTRGIMFNQLLRYMEQDFFDAHPTITVYTEDGVFTYTIFAFFQTSATAAYTELDFDTTNDYIEYCEALRFASWYRRQEIDDDSFGKDSRLLTLSTCTNGDINERYAVVALLTDSITENK